MADNIRIERLANDRYRLTVPETQSGLKIHVCLSPEPDAPRHASYMVEGETLEIADLPYSARHYFHLGDDGAQVLSDRRIAFQGTPNFRDFGGYRTAAGKRVRWGRLYRSGSLNKLTDTDLEMLAALNITTICDFRHDDERSHEPSRWPDQTAPRQVHLPLEEGDHAITLKKLLNGPGPVTREDIVGLMTAINCDFVSKHTYVYARLLQIILESDGPALIHCTAGKDRTGFGAAIILAALGVSRSTIMQDYMLTGEYLTVDSAVDRLLERYNLRVSRDVGAAVFGVQREYLDAALSAIDSEYGSFATYLREGLNFDESALRELRSQLLS